MDGLKTLLRRMQAWLRREEYVRAMTAEAAKLAFLEGHSVGLKSGYEVGLAQGELKGREALALELQQEHGVDGGERTMTRDELSTLKARQLH